ncbi:hypothetical protein [Lactiplantibacillus plajomi]|uniref:Uncharacterized protein n=1 Tax=Lactiplantibacillus plajomi TaxID=1457217 RepID=A0ABV6K1S2_9LACO|nr:hypothetical protein [Lactiplantibacillus plajomi]
MALNWLALQLPANSLLHAPFVSTKQGLVAVLYDGGSTIFNPWGWQIQPIGAIWFLLSMFIAI